MDWRARLREAVDRTGKKHSYVAERAGIAPATLSRILTGSMNPRFDVVVRIAHAAGESVGWIVGEDAFTISAADRDRLIEAAEIITRVTQTASGVSSPHGRQTNTV